MFLADGMPISSTLKPGLQRFLKDYFPLYPIPNNDTMTRRMEAKFESLFAVQKQRLANANQLCLAGDLWKCPVTKANFVGNVALLREGNKMIRMVLGIREITEAHTAVEISKVLQAIWEDWGLDLKKVIVMATDGAANIKLSVETLFSKLQWLHCYLHRINLAIKELLKLSSIKTLVDSVKAQVTFFRQSSYARDELVKEQKEAEIEELRMIQDCETRWNATFLMLQRFIVCVEQVNAVIFKAPKHVKPPPMVTAEEVEGIKELTDFLAPAHRLTEKLSTESEVSISVVLPSMSCYVKAVNGVTPATEIGKFTKKELLRILDSKFGADESIFLYAAATILDPRFKKVHFTDHNVVRKACRILHKEMLEYRRAKKLPGAEQSSRRAEKEETELLEDPLWKYHVQLQKTKEQRSEESLDDQTCDCDFTAYLQSPGVSLLINPIDFWISKQQDCPALAHVALKYVSLTCTSVTCERLFSEAKQALGDKSSQLTPTHLYQKLFMKSVEEEYWF